MSDSESSCTSPTPMSSSSSKPTNTKRCNKPQMERKRRERINVSLNMLKQLVLDALKKDTSQYSKLEKADILEMTVKHLRDLQRHQLVSAATSDVTVVGKYRAGFTECASEVTRYLGSVDGLKPEVRDRLMNHLSGCVQRVGTPTSADQHTHYMASGVATATSGHAVNVLPVSHPHTTAQPTVAATRPIQIQIPAATSPASLPGAGVQALQLAVTSGMSDAYQRGGSPSHQLPTPPPSQPGSPVLVQQQQQQQHTSAAYSPVGAPAYMAAFQVIPNAGPFMQQMSQQQLAGIVHAATPIYTVASPVQQAQLQQMILSQAHLMVGTSTAQQTPTTTTSPGTTTHSVSPPSVSLKRQAESHHSDSSSQAVKRMMTKYNPICGGGLKVNSGVKVAINDTLREEQVWRPW